MSYWRQLLNWFRRAEALEPQTEPAQPTFQVVKLRQRPDHVVTLYVPENIVGATLRHLRQTGKRRCEEAAFWGGYFTSDGVATAATLYLPDTVVDRGLVKIEDPKVLTALIDEVAERQQFLLAQVHSHPGEAFHSTIDDDGAICGDHGFLSFVVPNYAQELPPLSEWAAYELTTSGWRDIANGTIPVYVVPTVRRIGRRETAWKS